MELGCLDLRFMMAFGMTFGIAVVAWFALFGLRCQLEAKTPASTHPIPMTTPALRSATGLKILRGCPKHTHLQKKMRFRAL